MCWTALCANKAPSAGNPGHAAFWACREQKRFPWRTKSTLARRAVRTRVKEHHPLFIAARPARCDRDKIAQPALAFCSERCLHLVVRASRISMPWPSDSSCFCTPWGPASRLGPARGGADSEDGELDPAAVRNACRRSIRSRCARLVVRSFARPPRSGLWCRPHGETQSGAMLPSHPTAAMRRAMAPHKEPSVCPARASSCPSCCSASWPPTEGLDNCLTLFFVPCRSSVASRALQRYLLLAWRPPFASIGPSPPGRWALLCPRLFSVCPVPLWTRRSALPFGPGSLHYSDAPRPPNSQHLSPFISLPCINQLLPLSSVTHRTSHTPTGFSRVSPPITIFAIVHSLPSSASGIIIASLRPLH